MHANLFITRSCNKYLPQPTEAFLTDLRFIFSAPASPPILSSSFTCASSAILTKKQIGQNITFLRFLPSSLWSSISKDRYKRHRPLVGMASTVKNGIDRLRSRNLRRTNDAAPTSQNLESVTREVTSGFINRESRD